MRVLRTVLTVSLLASTLAIGSIAAVSVATSASAATQVGIEWISQTSAANNPWQSVTYGNGQFVAVAISGTNRVMTSPDGINWTSQTAATNNNWQSVTFGDGQFVAVSSTGTGNRVMTSPDGINWTSRTTPLADEQWFSVVYGNGLFVAVAQFQENISTTPGTTRVMTSPDGINWTSRTPAADASWSEGQDSWTSVTFGNGRFVAVSLGGRVMTSENGETWTAQTAPRNFWHSVEFGNGQFVALSLTGPVMTSPDGINWTSRTVNNSGPLWYSVTYGDGQFVAVSHSTAFMTSTDGIEWTVRTSAPNQQWQSVTYGDGQYVAVATSGTGNRVMTGTVFHSASHTVSFTVATTRSISVERITDAGTPGSGTTVAFGSVSQTGSSLITQVRLKFTADDAMDVASQVKVTAKIDSNTAENVTLEVSASQDAFSNDYVAVVPQDRVSLTSSQKDIITSIYGPSGVTDATSDLSYSLVTSGAASTVEPQIKTVTYTLSDLSDD